MKLIKSKLKQYMLASKVTLGSWISIPHESVVDVMALAGFDWLVLDMEHTTTTEDEAKRIIGVTQSHDMELLVRVGKNDELIIKKVLDAGANGIIVPMIKSREEIEKAISYTQYPPQGKRGVGLFRAQSYGDQFFEYREWSKNNLTVIAQIEHKDAVNNIDEILSAKSLDGVIIGPYDLSGSMGFPGEYNRKDVQEALEKIYKACQKYKIPYGFHVIESEAEKIKEKIDSGCTFLAFSIDFMFLLNKAKNEMERLKEMIS